MSDDSHGVAQVGLNYHRLWDYIRESKIQEIYTVQRVEGRIQIKAAPVVQIDFMGWHGWYNCRYRQARSLNLLQIATLFDAKGCIVSITLASYEA